MDGACYMEKMRNACEIFVWQPQYRSAGRRRRVWKVDTNAVLNVET